MRKKDNIEKIEILQEKQVVLSKERTILSFMQTGLAFVGVGVVIISVLKEILTQIIGYGLLLIGLAEVFESFRRLREKQKEMEKIKRKLR